MSFSLNGLIRSLIYLTVATSLTAVAIHRLAPQAAHFRILKQSCAVFMNGYHFSSYDRLPRVFDPESGLLSTAKLEEVEYFDTATCSPWENEQGESELVGRWLGRKHDGCIEGFGLARVRYPGGQLLDRVTLKVMPVSPPCFDPARPTSVLFAAGNGGLYRYAFGGASSGSAQDADEGEGVTPDVVSWNHATAGVQPAAICDPVWPADPRLKGRLIASFMYQERSLDGRPILRSRLAWLELNRERTEVVRSGRLIEPGPDGSTTFDPDETIPMLHSAGAGAGGRLTLAYLTHEDGERGWSLQTAAVALDESGIPKVAASQVRRLAQHRSHAAPVFSADGRRVYSLAATEPKPDAMEATPVPEVGREASARTAVASRRIGFDQVSPN